MVATYINCIAVIIGSVIGLLLKGRMKDDVIKIFMASSGFLTIYLGIKMALECESALVLLLALISGGLIGYFIKIEDRINNLGVVLQKRFAKNSTGDFAKGFLQASILFCAGAMTILGSIQAGLYHDYSLILVKSMMDGAMAIVFASIYGVGVAFSALFVLVFQGAVTLLSTYIEPILRPDMLKSITAVGGILMLQIAFNLLEVRKTKTGDFLPALLTAPLLTYIWSLF